MSYVTSTEFDRIATLPLALPQTEMRRQKAIQVTTIVLAQGQRLELRSLNLHLIQVLTPGVAPVLETTALGVASAGLYLDGGMLSGGIGVVAATAAGVSSYSPNQPVVVTAPGTYVVIVSNNSSNVDVTVSLTGSVRIFS